MAKSSKVVKIKAASWTPPEYFDREQGQRIIERKTAAQTWRNNLIDATGSKELEQRLVELGNVNEKINMFMNEFMAIDYHYLVDWLEAAHNVDCRLDEVARELGKPVSELHIVLADEDGDRSDAYLWSALADVIKLADNFRDYEEYKEDFSIGDRHVIARLCNHLNERINSGVGNFNAKCLDYFGLDYSHLSRK